MSKLSHLTRFSKKSISKATRGCASQSLISRMKNQSSKQLEFEKVLTPKRTRDVFPGLRIKNSLKVIEDRRIKASMKEDKTFNINFDCESNDEVEYQEYVKSLIEELPKLSAKTADDDRKGYLMKYDSGFIEVKVNKQDKTHETVKKNSKMRKHYKLLLPQTKAKMSQKKEVLPRLVVDANKISTGK